MRKMTKTTNLEESPTYGRLERQRFFVVQLYV